MSDCLSTSEARFVSPDKHQTPGGRNGGIHGVLYHNGKTLTIQSGPGNMDKAKHLETLFTDPDRHLQRILWGSGFNFSLM